MTWNARNSFGWLEVQENMDKYTVEKICEAKLRDKAEWNVSVNNSKLANVQE